MITVLIRIAPNKTDENSPNNSTEDDSSGLGAAILMESSLASILDRATILFNWIRSLTDLVVACCREIVISLIQPDATTDFKSPDQDYVRDLKKIEVGITLTCRLVRAVFPGMFYFCVRFFIFFSSCFVYYDRKKKITYSITEASRQPLLFIYIYREKKIQIWFSIPFAWKKQNILTTAKYTLLTTCF